MQKKAHEGEHLDNPAEFLTGLVLEGGWRVVKKLPPRPGSTGGFFSVGYLAEHAKSRAEGGAELAFIKALDLSAWRELSRDLPTAIRQMSEAFLFERRVVEECAGRRMENVVRGITHGQIDVGEGPLSTVNYLVLELAEGDIRASLDALIALDSAWALRVLHHVANGLRQLHSAGISHQDLKPSNVLTFAGVSKVTDVGRSFWLGHDSPHDTECVPGDVNYAPPECLYGQPFGDQLLRSRAIDAYHLGSMIRFMFTKVSATTALFASLDQAFYPWTWSGTFTEVLPYLREAANAALTDFERRLPTHLAAPLIELMRQLCDPDPAFRGIPSRRPKTLERYSMEYYVSRLNHIAELALLQL